MKSNYNNSNKFNGLYMDNKNYIPQEIIIVILMLLTNHIIHIQKKNIVIMDIVNQDI